MGRVYRKGQGRGEGPVLGTRRFKSLPALALLVTSDPLLISKAGQALWVKRLGISGVLAPKPGSLLPPAETEPRASLLLALLAS